MSRDVTDRLERRIERLADSLEGINDMVESAVRKAKARSQQLKMLLAEEVKKTDLSFDEVKALEYRWEGEPEDIFKGSRKWRMEDYDGRFEIEKSRDDIRFFCMCRGECASFRMPRSHLKELLKWLKD